jgi:hypothetical protein
LHVLVALAESKRLGMVEVSMLILGRRNVELYSEILMG